MPVGVTIEPRTTIVLISQQKLTLCTFKHSVNSHVHTVTLLSALFLSGLDPSRHPSCKGQRQRLRRRAAQALIRKSLHERPHLLQLVEAAAQRCEDRRRVRGMCHDGCRGGVLSDCGDPAQRRGRLHPNGAACTRNTHSSYWLFLIRLMNRWLETNEEAGDWKLSPKTGRIKLLCWLLRQRMPYKFLISPEMCILGLLSSRKGGEHWSILLLMC